MRARDETERLHKIVILQDLFRAEAGVGFDFKYDYGGKLMDVAQAKSKKELAVFLFDDNINVRYAAEIKLERLKDEPS